MNGIICLFLSIVALFYSFRFPATDFSTDAPADAPAVMPEEFPEDTPAADTREDFYSLTPIIMTGAGNYESHYIVNLPPDWEDRVMVELHETDTTYSYSFHEICSYESGYGGHLFTIYADSVGQDYSYLPAYEIIGTIEKDGYPQWTLVAIYPTDVQFPYEYYDIYNEMYAQIPEILDNITAQSGYTFIRGN